MGDPRTGEIYEGALRREGDVPLDAEQAARLKAMDIEARMTELGRLREELDNQGVSPEPHRPKVSDTRQTASAGHSHPRWRSAIPGLSRAL